MKLVKFAALALVMAAAGCVTAEQQEVQALEAQQRLAAVEAAEPDEKVSLDKSIDEYGEVTLLDDETGEEKLVCKYEKVTGSRFGTKVCATPKQWEQRRLDSRKEAEKTQRNMNAYSPNE
ncbi:MAG: hypothetical protein KDA46_14870 [Parvularculaceae bacterium]|nr:hypothetical protein [Parvularculaceae bacterium]